jgi:6-phosphofructokinase 1
MRIGVLTSGGDAPGMNACLRSIVKTGVGRGHTVLGIERGYAGLLEGAARPLGVADVDGISRHGGTILGSARCREMMTPAGLAKAKAQLAALGLDGLIVIGGNGSLTGAHALATDPAVTCRVVGVPASIDNDLGATALAIGVDTALNTIVEACDRISDTASAHRRVFIVEVMGRHCGYLAMRSGIAAEADAILYAEKQIPEDELVEKLRSLLRASFQPGREKRRVLIVKAEGVAVKTSRLVERLTAHLDEDAPGVDVRETILGHVVRGGAPSVTDRVIAQRLGFGAVLAGEDGATDVMCGWEPHGGLGEKTADPSVRRVSLDVVLEETARILDGTSPVVQGRLRLLAQAEGLLAL